MRHFGAFQAKTHFSEILANVIKGETVVVTKHGVEVAMIVPYVPEKMQEDPVEGAVRSLKKLRKGITLGKKLSIRKMIDEGRE